MPAEDCARSSWTEGNARATAEGNLCAGGVGDRLIYPVALVYYHAEDQLGLYSLS